MRDEEQNEERELGFGVDNGYLVEEISICIAPELISSFCPSGSQRLFNFTRQRHPTRYNRR